MNSTKMYHCKFGT